MCRSRSDAAPTIHGACIMGLVGLPDDRFDADDAVVRRAVVDRRLGKRVPVRTDDIRHGVDRAVTVEVQTDQASEAFTRGRVDETVAYAVLDPGVGPLD